MSAPKLTVEDLMTTAVIALHPNDTVGRLREEMALSEIRHIPVVDERNRVIGIVSDRDLHRAAGSAAQPRRVRDIMTTVVHTVSATTPAHLAAAILLEHRFGSLPVVGDDETLIGLITATDFLVVAQQALRGERPTDRAHA
jgi:CBS domain-containing protein